tara:strand:- start:122 stop:1033 length:912 start_codon:yes stop_codon:yes gene_type:complete
MTKYFCNRCGYSTNQITHFKNHLKRKKQCNPTLEDISIEQICFLYDFDLTNFFTPNHSKSLQITPKSLPNPSISLHNGFDSKHNGLHCEFCFKQFSRKDNITKHQKICKKKKEQIFLITTELDELKNELNKTKQQMINKSGNLNNSNNYSNISNNNSNNTTNNIIINNLGEEDIKHLDYNYYSNILKGIYGAVPKLVEKIHFDKAHPENQNIKLTNKKEPYIKIRKHDRWKLADRKTEVLDLIDSKCFLLSEKYTKLLKKNHNLTDEQQDKVNSFIEKYNEDNKFIIQDLINKTELMLLNNSK